MVDFRFNVTHFVLPMCEHWTTCKTKKETFPDSRVGLGKSKGWRLGKFDKNQNLKGYEDILNTSV